MTLHEGGVKHFVYSSSAAVYGTPAGMAFRAVALGESIAEADRVLALAPEHKDALLVKADALQWQLRRLEAMQEAGVRLMARPQLGKDVFSRGQPEGVVVVRRAIWDVKLFDLLQAYGHQVRPKDADTYQIAPMQFFSVEEAAERLGRMLGIAVDWQTLEAFLPAGLTDPTRRRSAIASTFVAGLQLAKDGQLELRQSERFGPIHVRKRSEPR